MNNFSENIQFNPSKLYFDIDLGVLKSHFMCKFKDFLDLGSLLIFNSNENHYKFTIDKSGRINFYYNNHLSVENQQEIIDETTLILDSYDFDLSYEKVVR